MKTLSRARNFFSRDIIKDTTYKCLTLKMADVEQAPLKWWFQIYERACVPRVWDRWYKLMLLDITNFNQ